MIRPLALALAAAGLAACTSGRTVFGASSSSSSSSSSSTGGGPADAGPGPVTLDDVAPRAAAAICGALFRCCGDTDRVDYFRAALPPPGQDTGPLAPFRDRVPPAAMLDAAACPGVVAEMLQASWLGAWTSQARDALVDFDPAAAAACLDALDGAACGRDVTAALYDDRCTWFRRTSGGPLGQRTMFTRTRTAGDDCRPLLDGFGGLVYGSCDPGQAYCCVRGDGGCLPFAREGSQGICAAAGEPGAACSPIPLKWCRTGLECGPTDTCVAEATAPLAVGAACAANNRLLGECTGGWCDILGDGTCHALVADGASCVDASQCASGSCQAGACAPFSTCTAAR